MKAISQSESDGLTDSQRDALESVQGMVWAKAVQTRRRLVEFCGDVPLSDVVQDLNLYLCKAFRKYNALLSRPTTYANQGLAWASQYIVDQASRHQTAFDRQVVCNWSDPDQLNLICGTDPVSRMDADVLGQCWAQLSFEETEAVKRVWMLGESAKVCGKRLGIKRGEVYKRLRRAEQVVRPILEAAGYGRDGDE